ncbi:hypothetical protein DV515_00013416, partial [Chloebia gouldiae]
HRAGSAPPAQTRPKAEVRAGRLTAESGGAGGVGWRGKGGEKKKKNHERRRRSRRRRRRGRKAGRRSEEQKKGTAAEAPAAGRGSAAGGHPRTHQPDQDSVWIKPLERRRGKKNKSPPRNPHIRTTWAF